MFEVENQTSEIQFEFQLQIESDYESPKLCLQNFRPQDYQFISEDKLLHVYSTRGGRSFNYDQFDHLSCEEFTLSAIYDGHGDETVALHLKHNLLNNIASHQLFSKNPTQSIIQCLKQTEKIVLENYNETSGSTVLIVLCMKAGIIVVNIGDSLCYGIKYTSELSQNQLSKQLLNEIHDLNNVKENQSIKEKGGSIFYAGGCYRISGELNITRSIGDKMYKKWITASPSITFYKADEGIKQIILASDGAKKLLESKETPQKMFQQLKNKVINFSDNTTMLHIRNTFST